MTQFILSDSDYTFDASAKTITLAAPYATISITQILKITDVTVHEVIYDILTPGQRISFTGGVITHGYDNTQHADTDDIQIFIDDDVRNRGAASDAVSTDTVVQYVQSVGPVMLHKELRVSTTAEQDSITPTEGKHLRVYAAQCSMLVTAALSATLRGTLAFGTGGTTDSNKVLASCRITGGDDAAAVFMSGYVVEGEVDETVTLTNITFSNGNVITRSVVYYTEED